MTQREIDRIMKRALKLYVSGFAKEAEKLIRGILQRLQRENYKNKV